MSEYYQEPTLVRISRCKAVLARKLTGYKVRLPTCFVVGRGIEILILKRSYSRLRYIENVGIFATRYNETGTCSYNYKVL